MNLIRLVQSLVGYLTVVSVDLPAERLRSGLVSTTSALWKEVCRGAQSSEPECLSLPPAGVTC